jgi:hypothetical protein
MMGRPLAAALMWVGLCLCSTPSLASNEPELRERLNKIFYWQMADELRLTPQVEKEMIQTLEDLQGRREKALERRSLALAELKGLGQKKDAKVRREQSLVALSESLKELGRLDAEEFERLSKALGSEALARFYVVREELATRVRDAIRSPSRNP